MSRRRNSTRAGVGGELRTDSVIALGFLGLVTLSQMLNAILMQLFCV